MWSFCTPAARHIHPGPPRWVGIGRGERKLHADLDRGLDLSLNLVQHRLVSQPLPDEPVGEHLERVAMRRPFLFFGFRTVIGAVDVADVMTIVAIGLALDERRTFAAARAGDEALRRRIDRAHVLTVDDIRLNSKCLGACQDLAAVVSRLWVYSL